MTNDWLKLKQEYILSDYLTVTDFLRAKLGPNKVQKRSGFMARKTAGWRKEKEDLMKQSSQEVVSKVLKSRGYKLAYALGSVQDILISKAQDKKYIQDLSVKDLKIFWQMLMMSNGFGNDLYSSEIQKGQLMVDREKEEMNALRELDDLLADKTSNE